MNTYLITYEIYPPSFPMQEGVIINAIKAFPLWARPTRQVWLIKTYLNRDQVINTIRSNAGPNDRILIMLVSNDWIALNLPNDVIQWMKEGL